jgi:hypothetical protein
MKETQFRGLRAFLIVASLVLLASCSRPRYVTPLHLLMGVGPKIFSVQVLPSGHTRTTLLARLPHRLDVDVLSQVGSGRVLVSTYPKHRIYIFNIKNRRFRLLRKGWNAVYFAASKSIVFLDNPQGGFTAQELWIAPLAAPLKARLLDHGPFPIQMPVVPVASNAFVYSSWRKTGRQRLWLYNISFNTFVPLHIAGIYPELWLPRDRLLLCVNLARLGHPYSLRTLQGRIVKHLTLGNWYTPAVALKNHRTILFGRQGGSAIGTEFSNDTLMAYDVQTENLSVVLRHTFVGVGTVVDMEKD